MAVSAPISAAGAGANPIVAGIAGKKIRVLGYVLVASGAVTAKWQSNVTDLTGAMALAANGGVAVSAQEPDGWFTCAAGDPLNLTLGGAVGVAGHVLYSLE